ncbi:hypothetical protein P171DRAFT_418755 [Karstenula rhodostoma CBS 690.94]|uniref:Uncharacterized protein n=1 Tax=Karstenula rhodostoma CBS 690.94 TaxID=1392251 RepID=A0A9P4PDK2_9PLEO|nr:hypothetical protein P171DRAFT_418755 [Karstenula rhodostoma CBS 690.94]
MFEFVSIGPTGRALPVDKLRIRSRAARDKNKRADSRRSRREAKRLALLHKEIVACASLSLPSPPPHDLQLVPFAEKIGGESQQLLYKIFSFKTLEQGKPPLERCIDFTLWDNACFEWLQSDIAFLQSVLTSAAMVDDTNRLSKKQPGNKMWHHLNRTMNILNSRLSNEVTHVQDSTLNVVLTLSILACAMGDHAAVRAHLSGLYRIVQLRGGIAFLLERPMLHFRINHIDLTWAMMSGERPLFLPAFVSWARVFPSNKQVVSRKNTSSASRFMVDERIVAVFQDMQHAVRLLNQGVKDKTRHTGETFQPILNSIQSRLLLLEGRIEDTFSECMRLAMLAFLSHAMNFPSVQFRATYLETGLKYTCKLLGQDGDYKEDGRLALELWIAVIAAGSLSSFRDDWLTQRLVSTVREHIPTWRDAKERLLSVMWIESIHDVPGETIFRRLFQDDEREFQLLPSPDRSSGATPPLPTNESRSVQHVEVQAIDLSN